MSHASPLTSGQKRLIAYLAFLNAFVPLSTDLYLPAMPVMARHFNATPDELNFTLLAFFFLFAVAMLVWGPLSDRYGRRPILLAGAAAYTAASVLCALSGSIGMLVVWRSVQAVGSGAISAVSMAIIKDTFKGRVMENVLAAVQTMTVLAPMVAPVLGGFLLTFTTWKGTFWVLSACGTAALLGGLFLKESLEAQGEGTLLSALGRIGAVLAVPRLLRLLLLFAVAHMAFMPFLATSSYIYQNMFGLSPQAFSLFFAANAVCSLLGPLAYIRFLRDLPKREFVAACFGATAMAGVALLLFGGKSAAAFALSFAPVSLCAGAVRPYGTMLMMNQLDSDNGTVAALIGSFNLTLGSIAILLCDLPWPDFITADGGIALGAGAFSLLCWLRLCSRKAFRGI